MRLTGAGSSMLVSGFDFTYAAGATLEVRLAESGALTDLLLPTTTFPKPFEGTPSAFLMESGTRISMYFSAGPASPLGEVASEQERAIARIMALAEPALRRLKYVERLVERRIVTLMWRVTYKTTTCPKLNSSYTLLEGLNPLSQTDCERQFCD